MFTLLTRTKSFRDPWVGSPFLNNHWQLHRRRVQLAEGLCRWRRLLRPVEVSALQRDGVIAIQNWLPADRFEALRDEVEQAVIDAERQHPITPGERVGFQPKQPFPGGFDRFDGGTLNRFLHIDAAALPHAADFSSDPRLSRCSRQVIGLPQQARKLDIYLTVHGESHAPRTCRRNSTATRFFVP